MNGDTLQAGYRRRGKRHVIRSRDSGVVVEDIFDRHQGNEIAWGSLEGVPFTNDKVKQQGVLCLKWASKLRAYTRAPITNIWCRNLNLRGKRVAWDQASKGISFYPEAPRKAKFNLLLPIWISKSGRMSDTISSDDISISDTEQVSLYEMCHFALLWPTSATYDVTHRVLPIRSNPLSCVRMKKLW